MSHKQLSRRIKNAFAVESDAHARAEALHHPSFLASPFPSELSRALLRHCAKHGECLTIGRQAQEFCLKNGRILLANSTEQNLGGKV
jgi:hypothetical protein